MSEERSQFAQRIDERKFKPSRRGYDKREVREYLEDLEQAFRELEGHGRRTSQRVGELERDLSKARATERVSVDNAMMAVFDAKDRILDRARRRADEIEEEAHVEAGRIREAAITDAGGAGGPAAGEIAAARAQADEIVAAARREADRMRNDAASDVTEDLEAELAALSAQVRRAHDDTASVKEELDAARVRIVQLESEAGTAPSEDLERKFAELEEHLVTTKAETDHLRQDLEARDSQVEALSAAVAAAEEALAQSKSYVAKTESALDAKDAETQQLRQDLDKDRTELEELRTAQQDHSAADERLESIEAELKAKIGENEGLTSAAAENEAARTAIGEELSSVNDALAVAGQNSDLQSEELQKLRESQEAVGNTAEALVAVEAKLIVAEEQAEAADFVNRMNAIEATLVSSDGQEETAALITEIARITEVGVADDGRTAELETVVAEGETSLAEAEERIAALEAELAGSGNAADDLEEARSQADAILAAARTEAEGIETEAEEQAEQRAARVIAKAREEADQVRQTVSTLTAQAEDARSAALRSKLEAEDLAETQRAISGARDDIVASAKSEAQELENEAEQVVSHARNDADRIKAESEEQAQSIVAEAQHKAEELLAEAERVAAERAATGPEVVDDDDELAALLAEAEQDVAISEGLRLQREELIQREQDLVELEQSVAAKHEEAALVLASARESAAAASGFASSEQHPSAIETQFAPVADDTTTDPSAADSDDPAERLSALLEQVAPSTVADDPADGDEPLDLDRLSEDLDMEPRARMAWPTPVNQDDSEDDADLDDPASDDADIDDDLDSEGEQRESRYRSRSAQLPRLGNKAKSNMTTMANLRKKSRGIND